MTTTDPEPGSRAAVRPLSTTATPSCHAGGDGPAAAPGSPVVALVGAPNCGKSTLFNALTGGKRSVGNWPGTTVEVGRAAWSVPGIDTELLDLPGAYSLDAQSPDEELTRDLLGPTGEATQLDGAPDLTVVVADAAHLTRSLYLVAQLRERSRRLVVALTMSDVAAHRGIDVDPARLAEGLGVPVVALDPRRRNGMTPLAAAVAQALGAPVTTARPVGAVDPDDDLAVADERFVWIESATASALQRRAARATLTDRIDRFAVAPMIGPLLFLAVMWLVFELTTSVAVPIQDALGRLFSGPITSVAEHGFSAVGLGDSWLQAFVVNGLIGGVGMLLTFVPLMAIMFLLLALLEDSGYMARAAVVTDRSMRAIGLPGKAFLPLVVGFGCNVPAISATRILPDARSRVLTALLVPFTSCSARLTVYVLIAATFFPAHAGTVVFGMYVASIALVVLVGLALRNTLWRTMGDTPLVLDLPAYQRPVPRLVGSATWLRVRGFLRSAGSIIVITVSAVWLLQAIPVKGGESFGHVSPDNSLFALLAKAVSPLFAPLGFGDWHTSSALLVGFVAKETVITSWAQTYAAADPTAGQSPQQLQGHLHAAFSASAGGYTTLAVIAFLIFLLAYTPCVATVAAQAREIGLRWTSFGIVLQVGIAWTLGCAVFQIGRLLT